MHQTKHVQSSTRRNRSTKVPHTLLGVCGGNGRGEEGGRSGFGEEGGGEEGGRLGEEGGVRGLEEGGKGGRMTG